MAGRDGGGGEVAAPPTQPSSRTPPPPDWWAELEALLDEFPLVLPEVSAAGGAAAPVVTAFHGLLAVEPQLPPFALRLVLAKPLVLLPPPAGGGAATAAAGAMLMPTSLRGCHLECDWPLTRALAGTERIVRLRLQQSSRVVDFLRELREIVRAALLIDTGADTGGSAAAAPGAAGTLGTTTTSAAAAAAASTNASHADFYPMLVAELERVGWAHVLEISADLRRLVFGLHDERQVGVPQLHRLQVQLRSGYPLTAPTVSSSLPRPFALRWSANGSSLAQLVAQFREAVRQCLPIWEALATVDQATWVLDPKNPGPAALDRRIALGGNCSLQLLLDPLRPRALPQIRFLGPDHRTQPLKTAFNKNAHTWSEDASLFDNLARCVGVSFPQPTEEDAEQSIECAICYSYHLDEAIPDQACDNAHCGKLFHRACLFDWLRALPSTRQSFDMLFGECPYCQTALTCRTH